MGSAPGEEQPRDRRTSNADDLAREQWTNRMAWSMMAAVAGHATVFALWPTTERYAYLTDPSGELPRPEWISLFDAPAASRGADQEGGTSSVGRGTGTIALRGRPEEMPGEGNEPIPVSKDEGPSVSEDLRARLRAEASHAPTLADLRFEGTTDGLRGLPGGASRSDDSGGGDLPVLRGLSALDLERLSAIRPEVALEATTDWLLPLNPSALAGFMRTRLISGALDQAQGSVSVALWVSATGSVDWAEIVESSGRPELDEIALALFKEVIVFRPARLRGTPLPIAVIFTVNFPWF